MCMLINVNDDNVMIFKFKWHNVILITIMNMYLVFIAKVLYNVLLIICYVEFDIGYVSFEVYLIM